MELASSFFDPAVTMATIRLPFLVLFAVYTSSLAVPLSTKSRWIVDEDSGKRVKLACANWAAHLEPMLPEGLEKRPLSRIALHTRLMGFNCVRLTWATYMYTRYAHLTVAENLEKLDLHDAIKGIAKHNPHLLSLTVIDAQKAVIEELGVHDVMVLLDNQVSHPMWCCADNDGNGFFGDKYFDPQEWLHGLRMVAQRYKHNPMVMGMSLRNELRGPKQNESVWYHYMEKGAKTIHRANPNVLVVISGLNYSIRFEYLQERPLKLKFKNKLVYETHRYAFSEGQTALWLSQPLNQLCQNVTQEIEDKAGFLFRGKDPAPLFVSEFGGDQLGENLSDNAFLACFISYLAENDLDWSLWALQGSYYLRDGQHDHNETYGAFNRTWATVNSPSYNSMLQFIQGQIQDPNSDTPSYLVIFHSLSGRCLRVHKSELHISDCIGMARWSHDGNGSPIKLLGSDECLTGVGDGVPVAFTEDCTSKKSLWSYVDKYQLAYVDDDEDFMCLEWDPYYTSKIVTKKCIISRDGIFNPENPQKQWFSLIESNLE